MTSTGWPLRCDEISSDSGIERGMGRDGAVTTLNLAWERAVSASLRAECTASISNSTLVVSGVNMSSTLCIIQAEVPGPPGSSGKPLSSVLTGANTLQVRGVPRRGPFHTHRKQQSLWIHGKERLVLKMAVCPSQGAIQTNRRIWVLLVAPHADFLPHPWPSGARVVVITSPGARSLAVPST